jgi:GntR family transcriptional regulator, transcriptional repressor for pyruvate dehydrogenase complex
MARLARSTNWEQAPVGHIKLFERVYEELLRRILGGDLPGGRRLPAEKDLCELFGVSRPVIRQALLRLRADGLVDSRKGSGSFVASGDGRSEDMVDPRTRIADWLKLFEFRFTFEPEAAARAAEKAAPERLRAIRTALDVLRDMTASGELGRFGDSGFHIAVAEASGNPYFVRALTTVRLEIDLSAHLGRHLMHRPHDPSRQALVQAEHEAICAAIERGAGEEARAAMLRHLQNGCDFMLAGHPASELA